MIFSIYFSISDFEIPENPALSIDVSFIFPHPSIKKKQAVASIMSAKCIIIFILIVFSPKLFTSDGYIILFQRKNELIYIFIFNSKMIDS